MYEVTWYYLPLLFIVDSIGSLFFWLKRRPLENPKKILLIRLEHIGDVLLTTPAFRSFRELFPDAEIHLLIREFTAPIVSSNTNVDRVIQWNAPWLSNSSSDSSIGVWAMIKKLRSEKFDLAIDFHGDPRNIILASLVAPYRVGFGVRGFGFLLQKVAQYSGHAIDRSLALAGVLGGKTIDTEMELFVSSVDRKIASGLLRESKRSKLVCISAGSGRQEKNWLPGRFASVVDELIEKYDCIILFTGTASEQPLVQSILENIKEEHVDHCRDLSGKTTLTVLAAVLSNCKLVIGTDSGTMHISRALNIPLISLFVKENANLWGYNETKYQSIQASNVDGITVDMVLNKVDTMRVLKK